MKVLGVDPGIHGGLAVVAIDGNAAPQVIAAIDVPLVGVKAKERVDVAALQKWLLQHAPDHALIERAQRCRNKALAPASNTGEASVRSKPRHAVRHSARNYRASGWKRHFHLNGGDKEGARQRALLMFPSAQACSLGVAIIIGQRRF